MIEKDLYSVLGVSRDATQKEIKKKYYILAKLYHPDANTEFSSEERFNEVNKAYNIFSDEAKREEYDNRALHTTEKVYPEFEKERMKVDIFIKYVDLMKDYRPRGRNSFNAKIISVDGEYVTIDLHDSIDGTGIKRGGVVSLRKKFIIPDGKPLYAFNATGIVKLIKDDQLVVRITQKRKAVLRKNEWIRLINDQDTRFLYENIRRAMNNIIAEKTKYKNFRTILTKAFTDSPIPLEKNGIESPENIALEEYFFLRLNREQQKFVNKAMDLLKRPNCYLLTVTGPGGTGKTESITEFIHQAQKEKEDVKILVTSFTNVAVDNVLQKLLQKKRCKDKIVRYASSERIKIKDLIKVSPEVLQKSSRTKGELLAERTIVGATLDMVGTRIFDDVEFDVAIIDECSMIEFPKFMLVAEKVKKLIMVGDEKQLQPFLDKKVKDYLGRKGLNKEEIESLQASFFSKIVKYLKRTDSSSIVHLLEQHRSYKEIIKFSNNTFYNNQLQTVLPPNFGKEYEFLGQEDYSSAFFERLFNPEHKIVWIETKSLPGDLRYSINRDWTKKYPRKNIKYFNVGNASIAALTIKELLRYLGKKSEGVEYRDKIGYISPFNDQVNLLVKTFNEYPEIDPFLEKAKGMNDKKDQALRKYDIFSFIETLESGTVHKYQGREKDIIIFDLTSFTGKRDALILRDEAVLNVALTRARYKLIIIGTIQNNSTLYERLHSTNYVNFVGLKNIDAARNKRLEFLKSIGKGHTDKFSYDSKDMRDYLREDKLFSSGFSDFVKKVSAIEQKIVDQDFDYAITEFEEERKRNSLLINLIDTKQLLGNIDLSAPQYSRIEESVHNILKNDILNNNSVSSIEMRTRIEQLEKDFPELNFLLESCDKAVTNQEKRALLSNARFGEDSLGARVLELELEKIRDDEECLRVKKEVEENYNIKIETHEIFKHPLPPKILEHLMKRLEAMPGSVFPPYGKPLCKNLLLKKTIAVNHPIEWLRGVIEKRPDNFDETLWALLRTEYLGVYGDE